MPRPSVLLLARGTARFDVLLARGTARFDVLLARGTARFDASAWLLASVLAACTQPHDAPSDALPLNAPDLPQLSCRAALVNGGECARRDDCGQGQRCTLDERVEAEDRTPLRLRCGPPLGLGAARARCSEGSECESGLCGLAGVCLEPCAESDDCPRGQTCQPVEVRVSDEALAPVAACARVAAFAPDVELAISRQEGLKRGVINRFPVTGLAQANLVFLKAECARSLRVVRIMDRSTQRIFFDLGEMIDGVVQINPSINEGALVPVLLPNNPRVTIGTEGFDFGVSVDADASIEVVRATRAQPGRVLDLNVFYVGGGKLVDETGLHPGSLELAEVIARLGERYAAVDIELGAVREYDVVGALRSGFSVLDVDASLADSGMVAQDVPGLGRLLHSAGVDDGGVNLFIVEKIGPLLGISGGTPGAAGLHGSPLSGVALALDSAGFARADRVLFHELGHQLGLFHTSEMDGFEIEPLSDTPACTAEQDTDGDGLLRGRECIDHGADNVMFWEGTGDALSAQQAAVLTHSLVLR